MAVAVRQRKVLFDRFNEAIECGELDRNPQNHSEDLFESLPETEVVSFSGQS
jgi:hypothetical protein